MALLHRPLRPHRSALLTELILVNVLLLIFIGARSVASFPFEEQNTTPMMRFGLRPTVPYFKSQGVEGYLPFHL